MDLGERDDLCDYDKVHQLIESTYKNILKNFNPGVKQLILLGKVLQKTIQNIGSSFKAYNECLYELARSAESCKGATNELGLALLQLADSEKEINQNLIEGVKVFHAELLIPLKAKQENEFRHAQVLYDKYLTGHKVHTNSLKRAQNLLAKCKKKAKTKSSQKEIERTRQMRESKTKMEEFLRKNLRLALLEERKRYCFLFSRLLCIVEDKANKYTRANEMFTDGLRTWPELCKSPHILPRSTERIFQEFGLSDDSCDVEENASEGAGQQHGEGRRATVSLTQDLKDESRETETWTSRSTPTEAATLAVEEVTRKSATLGPISFKDKSNIDSPEVKHQEALGVISATYQYVGQNDTQLSMEPSDVVWVYGDAQNGWLYGRNIRTDKEGWFPLSFTDFSEGILQPRSASSYVYYTTPNKSISHENIRNTWHSEAHHGLERSRSSGHRDADVTAAAAEATRKTKGSLTTTASTLRPSSYGPSATEAADYQRVKLLGKRVLPLEPISEQIPPPVEFRDRADQTHNPYATEVASGALVPISTMEELMARGGGGETRTHTSETVVKQTTLQYSAETRPLAGGGATSEARALAVQERSVKSPVAATAYPPPPSPSPPSPPLPNYPYTGYHEPSGDPGVSLSGVSGNPGTSVSKPAVSKFPGESVGTKERRQTSSPIHIATPPPPAPPPPPPLPPGTYYSVRGDFFAKPRLRKSPSADSTKTT